MSRDAVILVDPIATGQPFKAAVRQRGLATLSVITVAPELVRRMGGGAEPDEDVVFASTVAEVLAAARAADLNVRAVVPATEPGVDLGEALAAVLGLPGNRRWPGARRDKALMRERVRDAGLACPRFERVRSRAEVGRFIAQHGLPVVVKTPAAAGGHQVAVCRTREAALDHFDACMHGPDLFGRRASFLVIEEFLAGPELAVNVFVHGGECHVIDVLAYDKVETPEGRPIYLSTVQADASAWPADLVSYARQVCAAVGLDLGPAHVEVKLTERGPVLVEVGARLCGARLPEMWRRFGGFDAFAASLALFLGEHVRVADRAPFAAAVGLGFIPHLGGDEGALVGMDGLDEVRALPSFVDWAPSFQPGEWIGRTKDLENSLGTVYLAHADRRQLLGDLQVAHARLRPRLDPKARLKTCAH